MPDYKEGSYILEAHKTWKCEDCKKPIFKNIQSFVRVEETGEILTRTDGKKYRRNEYKRWHMACAKKLKDLTGYEIQILKMNIPGTSVKDMSLALKLLAKMGYKVKYMNAESILLKK